MKAKYLTEGDLVSCRNMVVTTNGKKSAEVVVKGRAEPIVHENMRNH